MSFFAQLCRHFLRRVPASGLSENTQERNGLMYHENHDACHRLYLACREVRYFHQPRVAHPLNTRVISAHRRRVSLAGWTLL